MRWTGVAEQARPGGPTRTCSSTSATTYGFDVGELAADLMDLPDGGEVPISVGIELRKILSQAGERTSLFYWGRGGKLMALR